jgi:hypothetical protein
MSLELGENGNLRTLVGYGEKMLQCPVLCSFLFNFQKEVSNGNWVLVNNCVFVVENDCHTHVQLQGYNFKALSTPSLMGQNQ